MAEQEMPLESEIARFDAETKKLEAETKEIKKRVGQKWYQNRNAVLLIVQTLIAGIIGAGAFTYALFEFYIPLQNIKAETAEKSIKLQELRLNEQINQIKVLKSQLETQETQYAGQKAAARSAEKDAQKVRKENETILAELMAIRAKDSLKAGKKTLSEKDLKSLERLEKKTEELALKAVPPPLAPPVVELRSKSKTLGSDAIFKMVLDRGFSLPGHKIKGSFRHKYETKTLFGDQVVVDHATGLIWQRGGSVEPKTLEETKKYMKEINTRKFAGLEKWRLPTIEELISLVEPELQNWDLFIDENFDETQRWIRSADQKGPNNSWGIVFYEGKLYLPTFNFPYYVRLVRSKKSS